MALHPDFRGRLLEFARFGVGYALIGGHAVGHHAKRRATKGLDLLVSAEGDDPGRVAAALAAFGAPSNVVDAARRQGPTEVIYRGVEPVRIDILRTADGIDPEQALARAEALRLDDLAIPVIGLADLIANKRAAGRARDLADAEMLERVLALRGPRGQTHAGRTVPSGRTAANDTWHDHLCDFIGRGLSAFPAYPPTRPGRFASATSRGLLNFGGGSHDGYAAFFSASA